MALATSLRRNLLATLVLTGVSGTAFAGGGYVVDPDNPYSVLQVASSKVKGSGSDVVVAGGAYRDSNGWTHYHFERKYKGLPVRGGDFVVTWDGTKVVNEAMISGKPNGTIIPKLSANDAIAIARSAYHETLTNAPASQLVILVGHNGYQHLAWEVDIDTGRVDGRPTGEGAKIGFPLHQFYEVDALTGQVLVAFQTTYNVNGELPSSSPWSPPILDKCPAPMKLTAPLAIEEALLHGEGHAVLGATIGTSYIYGETSGLIEAFSDVQTSVGEFGALVTWAACEASADPYYTPSCGSEPQQQPNYLIGEAQFASHAPYTRAFRYLFHPSLDGVSPNFYYDGIASRDPHEAAGPANLFFYLLAEGSATKTINGTVHAPVTSNRSNVAGIGRDKAFVIWQTAFSGYMPSNGNYSDLRVATINAALEIYGSGSAEVGSVIAAWDAVNVH